MTKKGLLTKKVPFQGSTITMYSIDGVTWSTRADELQVIIDRHVLQQASFSADLKGEEREKLPVPKAKPKKFTRVHDDGELDEIIDDDMDEEESDEVDLEDDTDVDLVKDVAEVSPSKKGKEPVKAVVNKPQPIQKVSVAKASPAKTPSKVASQKAVAKTLVKTMTKKTPAPPQKKVAVVKAVKKAAQPTKTAKKIPVKKKK